MNIESAREWALNLHPLVTEELFAENWIAFRICGKWFMLVQLDTPEPRVAVKMKPDEAELLREQHEGITPAYHMNKRHWSDLYLNRLNEALVKECIRTSYNLVVSRLPKKERAHL
ncbi:MAG TPA: MmcQ/YjbR family DNA-binding protein [Prevotella sp.]